MLVLNPSEERWYKKDGPSFYGKPQAQAKYSFDGLVVSDKVKTKQNVESCKAIVEHQLVHFSDHLVAH